VSKKQQINTEITGLLGISSRFEGEIRFEGTLRIDGVVNGKIFCKNDLPSKVIITEMAVVEADITADIVIISGQVAGNVKAIKRLEIHAPGRLEGLVLKMEHFYEIHYQQGHASRQSIQDPSEAIPLTNSDS